MSSSDVSGASEHVLHIICGPTAAGKSAVAMWLAQRHGCAIVSADSRQLYRGFDIGTAKPSLQEMALVPHYGVNVADPTERWSAARWARSAGDWLGSARADGLVPLVVGGTGFYISALATPIAPVPQLDPARRSQLSTVLAEFSTDELRRWTRVLDPPRAHLGRAQLLRAVETALLAGRRLSDAYHAVEGAPEQSADTSLQACAARMRYLVVDPGREALRERIADRVDAMLAAGWLEEVRTLMDSVPRDAPAWKATGYSTLRDQLEGRCSPREARERVIVDTRRYAKRQRTWFRHQLPESQTTHLNPQDQLAQGIAEDWWFNNSQ